LRWSLRNRTFGAMIETRQLTKIYRDKKRGEIRAVDGVSFQCHPGTIYGLLGVNGAGKTSCLRMLATILTPTSGQALVGGHDVGKEPQAVRQKIGFMSTSTALYGRLTAEELVVYFGRLHGLSPDRLRVRIDELFTVFDMHDFRRRRCDKLSTGMKQKVSIARTLVHDPPIMIFDEPTLGLDVLTARTIVAFIQNCRADGKTVIYSTHVMSEVEKLCDRIGIIHEGRLRAEGSLPELRNRYGETSMEDIFVKAVESST
jgi:sodium transport system ATP-binding protein